MHSEFTFATDEDIASYKQLEDGEEGGEEDEEEVATTEHLDWSSTESGRIVAIPEVVHTTGGKAMRRLVRDIANLQASTFHHTTSHLLCSNDDYCNQR